jgi:hypothetical protein
VPDEFSFTLEGDEEFVQTIDRMIKGLHPDQVEPLLNKGARKIAAEVRKNAPVGPRGNLKKAVKTKRLRRWGGPAPSIAAIDRKKAPHAWLVTHGSSGVRQVNPGRRVVINGQPAFITHTGVMPPNRFFANSVAAKQGEVLADIEKGLGNLLDEAMK